MNTVYISVTNDLISDYRVHRTALLLQKRCGFNVILIGRKLKNSPALQTRPYKTKRFSLPVTKGPFFYLLYNITLFTYLLFQKIEFLVANDLDTLPANYLISKIRGKKMVFDSHELFTEVPELIGRPGVRKVWVFIEHRMMPSAHAHFTVCQSIAGIYKAKYALDFTVIRNVPDRSAEFSGNMRTSGGRPRVILYQGMLNVGRGLEKMIRAMHYIDNAVFRIAGDGDIRSGIEELIFSEKLGNKVELLGRLPFGKLAEITGSADLGISLEENRGLNYYYALPNKLFAYIQSGIPVLASDFPEMSAIVKGYNIGRVTLEDDPKALAAIISDMLGNDSQRKEWMAGLSKAAEELCWEREQEVLIGLLRAKKLLL